MQKKQIFNFDLTELTVTNIFYIVKDINRILKQTGKLKGFIFSHLFSCGKRL